MTEDNPTPPAAPIPAVADFLTRYRLFETRAAELHSANKAALFAVLHDAGISKIIVRFDGYGDSGQIEEVTAFGADDAECPLPAAQIDIRRSISGRRSR